MNNDRLRKELHVDTNPLVGSGYSSAFLRYFKMPDGVDPFEHIASLKDQMDRIDSGDLSHLQDMLFGQAKTLATIFNSFGALSGALIGEGRSDRAIAYLQLALKAQEQSRRTILALAELKNPHKTTFIKNQLNQVAIAHQPTSQEKPISTLEASTSAQMDSRITREATADDQELATLEAKHRGKKRTRQKAI